MVINIPPEALEAAAKEIADANGWRDERGVMVCREVARATILAALTAWPGMHMKMFAVGGDLVLLPLPQENEE